LKPAVVVVSPPASPTPIGKPVTTNAPPSIAQLFNEDFLKELSTGPVKPGSASVKK
jgi:hypothetical protein